METFAELKETLRYNFSINAGWEPIVEKLYSEILATTPTLFKVSQIKEKFGGLRFYYTTDEEHYEEIDRLVRAAEIEASKTCEVCGRPGTYRGERAWVLTLCDEDNVAEPVAWDSGYN